MTLPSSAVRPAVAELRDAGRTRVLIIGGGINGIATFRDLALQGVDVTLVERGDFVSGASSASSHMIHGGVRYLENGEFRLVKESVTERNALIRTAPHYVKPLQTTMPIFTSVSGILSAPLRILTHRPGKPKERGALLIKIGMTLYDTFSRDGGTVPRHRFLGRKKALQDLPRLNPDVKFTATYYDASMHDPERLALDVLRDGATGGEHTRSLNYVEAVGERDGGVVLRDRESGEEFVVHADIVVNTSGPWTDLTNAALGRASSFMGGTKGSHVVLDNPELLEATGGREIFFENSDGRIVLIYPLKGRVMLGTTDIDADPRERVVCTEEEIDYFFDLVAHVYPDIVVDRSQIVYTFSGIRPLPKHDDTQPGFVSRDYRIERGDLGGTPVLSLVGGKWTTFRALAQHLGDDVLKALGEQRRRSTQGLTIGGGRGYPADDAARRDWVTAHRGTLDADRADALLERYGTLAETIIPFLEEDDDAPLAHHDGYSRREIQFLVEHEDVVHLLDLLLRRTSIAFLGGVTRPLLEELADVTGRILGWSDARRAEEIDDVVHELRESHRVEVAELASA